MNQMVFFFLLVCQPKKKKKLKSAKWISHITLRISKRIILASSILLMCLGECYGLFKVKKSALSGIDEECSI